MKHFYLIIAMLCATCSTIEISAKRYPTKTTAHAAATSDTIVKITGKLTVTYQNGDRLFVQDETAGLHIIGEIEQKYNPGDQITGMAVDATSESGHYQIFPVAMPQSSGTTDIPEPISISSVSDLNMMSKITKFISFDSIRVKDEVVLSNDLVEFDGWVFQPLDWITVRTIFKNFNMTIPAGSDIRVEGFMTMSGFAVELYPISIEFLNGSDSPTEVENVETPFSVYSNNGTLYVEATEGAAINVFDINGRQIANTVANSTLSSFSNLNTNQVIVTVDSKAIKTMIK